jgi:CPA2 family monovalent cation:H+ antiporter-2
MTTIAAAFAAAWLLGLLTQRLGLSPIVGYLLAGIVIGPYTPGFEADEDIAHQLAEVGVILLMFGVGLHFHLKDLLKVRNIAIPGAIVQSLVATGLSIVVFSWFGWSIQAGLVLGMAMSVASTVVLLWVLMDRGMLHSVHGHVAVGWLIVEDIFTVLALVMVPMLAVGSADSISAGEERPSALISIGWTFLRLAALVAIVLLAGSRVVPWVLVRVAKLRSRELFTLTVLVLSITVAVGSAALFGASVALGAFLAGMVVGQSPVSHQAAADALPMRDAFAVLFFVSVGMLFDPAFLAREPLLVAAGLSIVLVAKPLAAMLIIAVIGYSGRTALTVAFGLAQIGEFSFILSQVAYDGGILPEDGRHVLVACAIISISLNPLLFRSIGPVEKWIERRPRLWRLLNARANRRMAVVNAGAQSAVQAVEKPLAIIVGYGPVGRVVDALLRDSGMETVIVDLNMDTVTALTKAGRISIFGDATRRAILEQAGVGRAIHLVIALPHAAERTPIVLMARELSQSIDIIVRAHYLRERDDLERAGANNVVFEEGEAGIAMARHVMQKRGVEKASIERMLAALRRIWVLPD